jgi:putative acetyltransferase
MPLTSDDDGRAQVEEFYDRARTGANLVAVADADQQLIGTVLLTRDRLLRAHVASLGIAVHDAWHRRGIGTALLAAAIDHADNWLGLGKITLNVATDNAPAIALYRKFGFEQEGCLRKHVFRAGRYIDVLVMARLSPLLQAAS